MTQLNCEYISITFRSLIAYVYALSIKWYLYIRVSSQATTPVISDIAAPLIAVLESGSAPNDAVFDILLAEDNLVKQKLVAEILKKYGQSVEIAEKGSLAVDAFRQRVELNKQFDVVLVSIYTVITRCIHLSCLLDGCINANHGWYGSYGALRA